MEGNIQINNTNRPLLMSLQKEKKKQEFLIQRNAVARLRSMAIFAKLYSNKKKRYVTKRLVGVTFSSHAY